MGGATAHFPPPIALPRGKIGISVKADQQAHRAIRRFDEEADESLTVGGAILDPPRTTVIMLGEISGRLKNNPLLREPQDKEE